MSAPEVTDQAWRRAVEYPYRRPAGDFVFDPDSGSTTPLDLTAADDLVTSRRALLAIGSNAAPEQLARKFPSGPPIPVIRATLRDHDVVFAAMLARYGAIPATLTPSEGTACAVHLTLLTDDQVEVMHASEGVGAGYDVVALDDDLVSCAALAGPVHAYRARAGALDVDGSPRSLAAIAATGRRFAAWTERQALGWLASQRGTTVEGTVAATLDGARAEINAWLESLGRPTRQDVRG